MTKDFNLSLEALQIIVSNAISKDVLAMQHGDSEAESRLEILNEISEFFDCIPENAPELEAIIRIQPK